MCYAIPGKVHSINGNIVIVDYFGQKKRAINELKTLAIGDYVYAQGGYVIQKLETAQAQDILATWQDMFSLLNEVDKEKFSLSQSTVTNDLNLRRILDQALVSNQLKNEDSLYLINLANQADTELFLKTANFLRQKYHQNACCVHGIIEISNYCKRNCYYCGISTHNQNLKRYRMNKEEIILAVYEAIKVYGFKAILLQSGEDVGYSINELADIIEEIKRKYDVLILISFGEIGYEGLKDLFKAGARGLLMRFETSNEKLYSDLHPGYILKNRIAQIKQAYQLGYFIITGGLIGLPGQTKQDIINDILLAKELKADMYSFGPFLPHANTPLGKEPIVKEIDILKTLALIRLLADQEAKILVTTALETLDFKAREKALLAGASSLMINLTPLDYRKFYSIYPNRAHERENLKIQVESVIQLLKSLGRIPIDLGI